MQKHIFLFKSFHAKKLSQNGFNKALKEPKFHKIWERAKVSRVGYCPCGLQGYQTNSKARFADELWHSSIVVAVQ
jgi:hypothetical protein